MNKIVNLFFFKVFMMAYIKIAVDRFKIWNKTNVEFVVEFEI